MIAPPSASPWQDHGYWIVKEHDGGKFVDGDCQAFKPDL